MSLKYRTSAGTSASNFTDLVVKVGDTLPIGTEVDYDGQTAPAGWQEVDDPNVYSTTETRIGTWIDGKPIYRKVIDYFPTGTIGQDSAITDVLVPHNVSNLKQVVDCKMVSASSSGAGIFPHIGTTDGKFLNRGTSIVSFDTTILRLRIINDTWTSSHFYITIEYTKTTD